MNNDYYFFLLLLLPLFKFERIPLNLWLWCTPPATHGHYYSLTYCQPLKGKLKSIGSSNWQANLEYWTEKCIYTKSHSNRVKIFYFQHRAIYHTYMQKINFCCLLQYYKEERYSRTLPSFIKQSPLPVKFYEMWGLIWNCWHLQGPLEQHLQWDYIIDKPLKIHYSSCIYLSHYICCLYINLSQSLCLSFSIMDTHIKRKREDDI